MNEPNEESPLINADKTKEQAVPSFQSYLDSLENYQRSRTGFSVTFSLYNLVLLISITVILHTEKGDCDTPIRDWLFIYAVSCAIAIATQLWIEISVKYQLYNISKWIPGIAGSFIGLFWLFNIVWFVLGNVWLFGDNGCEGQFDSGYVLSLIIISISYVGFSSLCICCYCCCCCGMMMAGRQAPPGQDENNL